MKRNLRRILPILLIILLLVSLVWYFFVYDRVLTRDLLLQQARYHDSKGNHSTASWFYHLAYRHAENDEDVAIELAEQYKAAGNYTKAEYTLSNAIANGGSVKLYIALCKTYVEQDKLLDAVNMLSSVSNESIKAELEWLRPEAPAATLEPGFYSQYISVDFKETDATLYVTTDGQYPSVQDQPFAAPIPLSSGETLVYAIAVGDNGLVSPLSVLGYTIGGVVEKVTFADSAVEEAVRAQLKTEEGKDVYTNDLWSITEFTVPKETADGSDLSKFTQLRKLTMEAPVFSDFSFLSSLGQLEELSISGSILSSETLEIIGALPNLTRLSLPECGVSNITALGNAVKLTSLNLDHNSVQEIEPLGSLPALQTLSMRYNAMTNLEALAKLAELTSLDIAYNSVVSTAPLAGCTNLRVLDISGNALMKLEGIEKLTGLTSFIAAGNNLVAVDELAACTGLTYLDISSNSVLDIGSLSSLVKLETFLFHNNEVSALPQWPQDLPLIRIDGSYNDLKDLNALSGLKKLNYVYMDHNKKLSSVDPLKLCDLLIQVNVFGTKVSDVSMLPEGVIVNYDPT